MKYQKGPVLYWFKLNNEEGQLLGLLVDAVDEILDLPESNIMQPPDFGADIRNDFIQGMGRVGDQFIILLDINRVLALKELSQLKQVADQYFVHTD